MVNPTRHDLHPDTKALGMVHRKPKGVPRSAIEMHSKECQDLGKCEYFGLADVFVVIFRKTEEISRLGVHNEGPTRSSIYGDNFSFCLVRQLFLATNMCAVGLVCLLAFVYQC